jgi:pimeloyl-ACP methyl ester carboxylesterase
VALVEPTTELVPTATGVVLDAAGHMAHVDQPEAWLAAVRAFLDGPER